ncbi:MAG TPA: aminoglycoside phosphotransferase family protein [Actinomycetota bacterium]|nr:aminoglycoside phosphotransferase family protein [Actinomycetota bacterium]
MSASALSPRVGSPRPPSEVVELARHLVAGDGGDPRLVAQEPLKRSVHRLCFEVGSQPAWVVVKRLPPRQARVNQLVAERWLPAAGLEWACPGVRGILHDSGGRAVWHVYDDLGGNGLDCHVCDPGQVAPVVELLVELHVRFAGHALLAECREHGEELGMAFFTQGVGRCVRLLKSVGSAGAPLSREQAELRDRLLGRVERLYGERHERALLLQTSGGPDTLLHGDLWTTNTLVVERTAGVEARLIDWDHAGVGPVTYDLSTFLYRFPPEHRPSILGEYRDAAARRGWWLPADPTLNLLFETAEYARYACCLAEAALAAARGEPWGFEDLAEIDTWFDRLEPVLAGTEAE